MSRHQSRKAAVVLLSLALKYRVNEKMT